MSNDAPRSGKREDENRTFEDRRAVYVEYYQRLKTTALLVTRVSEGYGDELPEDWHLPMFENLRRVEIFAYRPVYLLCGRHHTTVHRDRLTARVTPSGVHWNRIPGSYDTALADTLTDSDLDGPRP